MSTTKTLDIQRPSPHVARVWLNRPEVRNAFNDGVVAELALIFAELGRDESLRAIVLGGHGKAFCAGADLSWMKAMAGYTWDENRADAQRLADMLWAIQSCPVPVVARIHGDCYAGGVGLAAVCDIRVAASGVTFCLSEARLGLLPATIGPYVVRAMGESASRRYFTTAERFTPRGAPHRLRARGRRARGARRDRRRARRRARRQRAAGGARMQAPRARRGRRPHRRGPARRHRASHRRHPRQRRRPRGRAVLPRQARAGLAAAGDGKADDNHARAQPRTLRDLPGRRLRRHRRAGARQPEHARDRHVARPARGGGLCARRRYRLHDTHAVGGARRVGAGRGLRGAVHPRQARRRGLPALARRAGPARPRRAGAAGRRRGVGVAPARRAACCRAC